MLPTEDSTDRNFPRGILKPVMNGRPTSGGVRFISSNCTFERGKAVLRGLEIENLLLPRGRGLWSHNEFEYLSSSAVRAIILILLAHLLAQSIHLSST